MSNSFTYDKQVFSTGDTIKIDYMIKEEAKERLQPFTGILIKIRGQDVENRMITLRYRSKSGIGMERIFPLSSPYIKNMSLVKKTSYTKSKAFFIRDLSDKKIRQKMYKHKNA